MNSFNHYAYGSVQEWMYRHLAGIETTEQAPGFAHPILQPKPDTRSAEEIPAGQERITWVRTSFASPVGLIESAWDMTDGFTYTCRVPVTSTLHLPRIGSADALVINGVAHKPDEFKVCPCGKGVEIELAPGAYTFEQK